MEHYRLLLISKALTAAKYLSLQLKLAHLLKSLVTYSHRASAAACMNSRHEILPALADL